MTAPMEKPTPGSTTVYVVHVYDAAEGLSDYYVRRSLFDAIHDAAVDVVDGHDEDLDDRAPVIERVFRDAVEEPGVGRWHVRHGAWLAHVDEMPVR